MNEQIFINNYQFLLELLNFLTQRIEIVLNKEKNKQEFVKWLLKPFRRLLFIYNCFSRRFDIKFS